MNLYINNFPGNHKIVGYFNEKSLFSNSTDNLYVTNSFFFFKIAKTLKSFSLIKFFPNKFFQIKLISN